MARRSRAWMIVTSLAAALAAVSTPTAASASQLGAASGPAAGVTELISQDPSGNPGNNNREGLEAAISGDGNLVAFPSKSTNLVPGTPAGQSHIYLRNRQTGQTVQVDKPYGGGTQQDGGRGVMSFSADGRRLVFASPADNLVRTDRHPGNDVFVYDVATQRITLVSRSASGFANAPSYAPDISANGRFVAYHSAASNLVPNDTNDRSDIFVVDLVAKTISRVSVSSDGGQSDETSFTPSISGDGRYVSFLSDASTLVPDLPPFDFTLRVFVHDRVTGVTTLISRRADGTPVDEMSATTSISDDGAYIAWSSNDPDVATVDANDNTDVFLTDRVAGTTTLVSRTPAGSAATGKSQLPSISGDGRYVAYQSSAEDLTGDDPDIAGVFRWDRVTGQNEYVSATPSGESTPGTAWYANTSADGQSVEYTSDKDGLVPNGHVGSEVYVWQSE